MKKCIHNLDFYPTPFEISFQNQTHIKSFLGFFFSLVSFAVIIIIIVTEGASLITRSGPNVNVLYEYFTRRPNVTLNNNFTISFTSDGMESLLNNKYFETSFYEYLQIRDENYDTINSWRNNLGIIKCDPLIHGKIYNNSGIKNDNSFKSNFINSYCMKNNDAKIGGEYFDNYFSNVYLEIKRCRNSTLNNFTCKSDIEIDEALSRKQINIFRIETYPNVENLDKPLVPLLRSFFLKLDPTMYFQTDLFFSIISVQTDDGLLTIQNKTKSNYFFYQNISPMFLDQQSDGLVLRIYFSIGEYKVIYKRYYTKVQDILGNIGGTLEIVLFVGYLSTGFFNGYKMQEIFINSFINFDEANRENTKDIAIRKSVNPFKKIQNEDQNIMNGIPSEQKNDKVKDKKFEDFKSALSSKMKAQLKSDKNPFIANNLEQDIKIGDHLKKAPTINAIFTEQIGLDDLSVVDHSKAKNNDPIEEIDDDNEVDYKENKDNEHIDELNKNPESNKQIKSLRGIIKKNVSSEHLTTEQANEIAKKFNSKIISKIKNSKNEVRKSNLSRINNSLKPLTKDGITRFLYRVSMIDIIGMHLCCCFNKYRFKKFYHDKFTEKIVEYIDYEKVIKEIISYKHYKNYVVEKKKQNFLTGKTIHNELQNLDEAELEDAGIEKIENDKNNVNEFDNNIRLSNRNNEIVNTLEIPFAKATSSEDNMAEDKNI